VPQIATGVAKLGNDLNRLSRRRSVALEDVFHGLIRMPDGDNRCGVFFRRRCALALPPCLADASTANGNVHAGRCDCGGNVHAET
jgi:hypothetical protein